MQVVAEEYVKIMKKSIQEVLLMANICEDQHLPAWAE